MSCIVLHTGALGDIIVSIPVMVAARAAFMPPLAAIGPTDRLNLASEGRGPIDTVLRLDAVDSARLFGDPLWLPRALPVPVWLR